MERSYVLDGETIIVLKPHSCDFNTDFGHCRFPIGKACECSADWNDPRDIDFPKCCPLKQQPDGCEQMELDFAGKWNNLMHFTYLSGFSQEERVRRWHNWEPN